MKIDESLGQFYADERKFKQILLNLLSNAIKFTPQGGVVKLEAQRIDSSAVISVIDNGTGIAAENQDLIFEEFRQVKTKERNKPEGTGLGLALTKKSWRCTADEFGYKVNRERVPLLRLPYRVARAKDG